MGKYRTKSAKMGCSKCGIGGFATKAQLEAHLKKHAKRHRGEDKNARK